MSPLPLQVKDLGHQDYLETWQAMKAFTERRDASTADELWFVEHDPVYTQGQAGKPEHVLNPGDIPVIPIDRGGQVTYHAPGQLIAYVLVDLKRRGLGVKQFVRLLEQAIINVLNKGDIKAKRLHGAPGVYVDGAKIAALGLRIRHGCSYHGLALNLDLDLEPYQRINPCGHAGMSVTSLARLGVSWNRQKALAYMQSELLALLASHGY